MANEQILIKAREYGEAGQELKMRRQIAFTPPNEAAVDEAGRRQYPITEKGSLTEGGKIMFSEDIRNHRRMVRELKVMRQRLCGFLLRILSTAVDQKVRVIEGFAEAERNDDSLKLYQIIEAEASGQGAQSIAVSVSELLNLKMKGDFFSYLKEFRRIADVLKKQEPGPAKLLEAILNGKFVIGLEYTMFPQLNEMYGKWQ